MQFNYQQYTTAADWEKYVETISALPESDAAELQDYLLAAGKTQKPDQASVKKKKSLNIQKMYENLSAGQQKTVYDFMDYLANYKK